MKSTSASSDASFCEKIPYGELGLVVLESSRAIGNRVNDFIVSWRSERENEHVTKIEYAGYKKDSYLV